MRWLVPALAVSVTLHGALLGYVGPASDSQPGSDSPVSSTVIVFDAPLAPAASGADGSGQDQATSAGSANPAAKPEDRPSPDTEDLAEVEPGAGPETPIEPEPVAEAGASEAPPEPETEPVSETAVIRSKPVAEAEPAPAQIERAPVEAAEPDPVDSAGATAVPVPQPKPPLPEHVAERLERQKAEAEARRQAEDKRRAEAASQADAERQAKTEARRKLEAGKAAAKTSSRTSGKDAGKNAKPAARSASKAGSAGQKGGASAGDKRAYAGRVLSHIQRFKRYPSGTTASGVVRLAVSISGSGALRSASVRGSSGHSVLDRAAVATARAAAPYPAPPGGGGFSFNVSLRYTR